MNFREGLTLPHIGSRAFEQFERFANMTDEESDAYFVIRPNLNALGGQGARTTTYSATLITFREICN